MAYEYFFVLIGGVCLITALVEAWLLVARFASDEGAVAKLIPGKQDLLRSHIDYLMMAQFLFVFFALFKILGMSPPGWVVACACIGSFFNPFAFLVRAVKPGYLEKPAAAYKIMIGTSCVLTTVGYASVVWLLSCEAVRAIGS